MLSWPSQCEKWSIRLERSSDAYAIRLMGLTASQITNLTIVLLNRSFRCRWTRPSKFRLTVLCAGNSLRKISLFDDGKKSICFSCEHGILNTAHKSCVILQMHNAKSMCNDELNETLAPPKNGLISTGYHNVFAMIFSNEPCKFYSASDRKTSWSLSFLQTHLLQGISRRNSTPFSTFHQGQANGSRCAISVSCIKLDVSGKGCFL